ncbi:MAG: DUF1214 domain-containing protein [Deltaproteobacteria bacterium]|nr:DUF1214 domain-containing protein [Deltaproteobacteria bacterium]
MSNETTPSQAAWNRFAEQLKEVGEKIVGPIGARSPRERVDGFRYLASLIAGGHELEMEADRAHPVLARAFTPLRGPDTLYHDAKLDESLCYEFTIRRSDDIFFSIVVYASDDDGMRSMVSFLIDKDIAFEEDAGDQIATIQISAERPEGATNWLKLEGNQPFIMTRQYFPECVIEVDKGKYRPAIMNIECATDVPPPEQYAIDDLSAGLDRLIAFMHDTVDAGLGVSAIVGMSTIEYESDEHSTPTRIGADGQLAVEEGEHEEYTPDEVFEMIDPKVVANNLPGPGIGYAGVSFKLADDEAILIEGKDVPCRYWSCQVFDHYLRAGDYRHYPVAINNRQTVYDEDGSFRIYACGENPGVKNWVSTEGRHRGQVVLRTLLAETDLLPEMSVIKIADIPEIDRGGPMPGQG